MDSLPLVSALIGILFALLVLITVFRSVRIVGQGETVIVERLGRYNRTLTPGLSLLVPFVDRVHQRIDMREQVVSFPPQPVITQDNLVVSIDSVIYFTVTDPQKAAYEMANPLMGIEQLTVTTLRNVIGSLDLEATLTSRDEINSRLRAVLDEATGQWGIRVNRVELKAIDPPASVQEAMEKQMRAERERRAVILTAEGEKGSAILSAEGAQQAAVLRAQGDKQAAILRAEGEAQALNTVVQMIHESGVDETVLAYQYLQTLPAIANGAASKVWVIPAELSKAVGLLGEAFTPHTERPVHRAE
ncbi:MAG TPA: hypothetical protein DDY88_09370 [Actinobacteria bacterium]|nr:hypothetical protein [Actinomycetota bacterium]